MDYGRCAADALDRNTGRGPRAFGKDRVMSAQLSPRWKGLRLALLACAAIGGISTMVGAQESLLPPGFDDKPAPPPRKPQTPRPAATSAPAPSRAAPAAGPAAAVQVQRPAAAATGTAAVAPLPQLAPEASAPPAQTARTAPAPDPLAGLDPALIEQLVASAKPKADIPPQAQRSLARVGFLDEADGGFPAVSSHYLNGPFVAGLLAKMHGELVSRWGHILLRRALASRLDTPVGYERRGLGRAARRSAAAHG